MLGRWSGPSVSVMGPRPQGHFGLPFAAWRGWPPARRHPPATTVEPAGLSCDARTCPCTGTLLHDFSSLNQKLVETLGVPAKVPARAPVPPCSATCSPCWHPGPHERAPVRGWKMFELFTQSPQSPTSGHLEGSLRCSESHMAAVGSDL